MAWEELVLRSVLRSVLLKPEFTAGINVSVPKGWPRDWCSQRIWKELELVGRVLTGVYTNILIE